MEDYKWNINKDNEINAMLLHDMEKRGRWLTELDKELEESGSASYKDIEDLPGGRISIPWTCGAGKTAAIRRFIVENAYKRGVFSTELIVDVDAMYYDIQSQHFFLKKRRLSPSTVVRYHSSLDVTVSKLRDSSWILCTHNRLFIEPPTILMTIDAMSYPFRVGAYRKFLFIDEYPVSLYRSIYVKDLSPLQYFDTICGSNMVEDNEEKHVLRNQYLKDVYDEELLLNPIGTEAINKLDCSLPVAKYSFDNDKKRGLSDNKSEINRVRLGYFTSFFLEKLDSYLKDTPFEEQTKDDKLYYSINDYLIDNIYIFDGVSDILLKESSKFGTIDNKFERKLTVDSVFILKNEIKRTNKVTEIAEYYSKLIDKVCEDNKNKRILVYTWKTGKKLSEVDEENNYLLDLIKDTIKYKDKVDLISYMSGMERVTSEFKSDEVLIVLGKFFIPNQSIKEMNIIAGTELVSEDYTESLIIQCIYRTCARDTLPLIIYFTDDYDKRFIKKVIEDCNCKNEYLIIDDSERTDLLNEISLFSKLVDGMNVIDSYVMSIDVFKYSRIENNRVINKLNNLKIEYDYVEGSGRNNNSYYMIYNQL